MQGIRQVKPGGKQSKAMRAWVDATSAGYPGVQMMVVGGTSWHPNNTPLDQVAQEVEPGFDHTCDVCGGRHRALHCQKMGVVTGPDGVRRVSPKQVFTDGKATAKYKKVT